MKKVLIGITGSISAYKVYDIVRALTKEGCSVRCMLSEGGKRFMNKLILESLTVHEVIDSMWDERTEKKSPHISSADWADVLAVVPATADMISKARVGAGDCVLSATLLAMNGPVLMAPAMHTNMWNNAAVQENVNVLKERGIKIIGPAEGSLCDGSVGAGHIADSEEIINEILKLKV